MVDLKGVYRVTAKGKTYFYAWRGPKAPRLVSAPGTRAFIDELALALSRRGAPDETKISGLRAAYEASNDWKGLAVKTRSDWTRWLDRIESKFGSLSIAQFDRPTIRPDIIAWRESYAQTPRAADMGIQVLSRLMAFAIDLGKIRSNPCAKLGRLYDSDRSEIIWTADDFTELEKFASKEVFQAARLASLTGLRKSDLLRLSWSHIQPHSIEIRTGKSGETKTAVIPLYDELRAYLGTIRKRATTVLVNTEGKPWRSGFGASWNTAKLAADLSRLHFHDLRGTAATRFYLGDLTIREIAEILAWSEDRVEALINRYVKRDELLKDRIRRMAANAQGTASEKPGAKP